MAIYRTRTYIAGDWDNDKDAVDQLHKWNDSNHWSLSFTDAHDLTSSRDSSLNCTIKASLKTRMGCIKNICPYCWRAYCVCYSWWLPIVQKLQQLY